MIKDTKKWKKNYEKVFNEVKRMCNEKMCNEKMEATEKILKEKIDETQKIFQTKEEIYKRKRPGPPLQVYDSNSKKIPCTYCNKGLSDKKSLKKHIYAIHNKEN